MKNLTRCAIAITLAAAIIGVAVFFALGGADPVKKLMKEHPYVFEAGKTIGTERQDSYSHKDGCVYISYPETKNESTDQAVAAYLSGVKAEFDQYLTDHPQEEGAERQIPRLVFDYKTEQTDAYCALTCFYEITPLDENGTGTAAASGQQTYYLGENDEILDLDGVLGENTEKKIDLMLKNSGLTTADLQTFTIEGDQLVLRWEDAEKELSVSDVERASLIDPDQPMIALTFDDGPGKYSRQFADLLAEYNGHATFFVLGMNVPNFADSLKYVYDMGNEIGSHTMRHKNLNKLSKEGIRTELDDAAEAIYDAIGAYPTLVRTPYGNANDTVMSVIDGPMIKWSVDTEDWKSRDAQAVKAEVLNNIQDGDIVLMHEIYKSTYDGLAMAIKELADQGYQFVTVSELMQYRGVEAEKKIYRNFYPEES